MYMIIFKLYERFLALLIKLKYCKFSSIEFIQNSLFLSTKDFNINYIIKEQDFTSFIHLHSYNIIIDRLFKLFLSVILSSVIMALDFSRLYFINNFISTLIILLIRCEAKLTMF